MKGEAKTASRELLHVVMLVMRTVAADMRRSHPHFAPVQMGSLMRIAAEPCTTSDLARHQAVSLPTISKSVDMLERRRWVDRWVHKQDRRQTIVRLTPSGRRVLGDIKQRAEWRVAATLAPLAPGERAQLIAVMKVLTRILGQQGDRHSDC